MEEIAWKCSAAFLLGAATHYLISHHLQGGGESAPDSSSNSPTAPPAATASTSESKARDEAAAQDGEDEEEFESDDSEWEDMDEQEWQPHKMVLCVRTDLKMGKGTISICCCYWVCGCEKVTDFTDHFCPQAKSPRSAATRRSAPTSAQ